MNKEHTNHLPVLNGENICLQPLQDKHYPTLQARVLAMPEAYRHTTLGHCEADFARWFVLAQQHSTWVVLHRDNETILGSTRLYRYDYRVGSVNIGYTWFVPDARGTGVNTESKYLLLTHVFETLSLNRCGFDIDAENQASRRAVEKLGATLEGELLAHRRRSDGSLGNTCIYALLAENWHETKIQLQQLLKKQ